VGSFFCTVSNYEFRKRKWREIEAPKSSTILKSDYNTNSGEIDHLADFIGACKLCFFTPITFKDRILIADYFIEKSKSSLYT
jgi:hypothetical protein